GSYEYKIIRGGWDRMECKKEGAGIQNRQLILSSDTVITLNIEGWSDHFPAKPKLSTASKNVHIISAAFLIPQLKRLRRIWIYLPNSYNTSKKRYPVLYMHDGQNLFEDTTSYSGEWGVDECLDTMKKKCIVVAIDNGGDKRLNEYCPYNFSLKGIAANYSSNKGEGNQYVDFLVKTLKPFIDKKYRTLQDKNHTFIAGSSMGGLISMYAVLKYPNVFGCAGIFSPAFWVGPKIFTDIKSKGKKVNSKIYFYAGKQESESMVPDMLKAIEGMNKISHSKLRAIIRDDGRHNEQTWRREFPLFYQWIMPPKSP
ncbi:MAG TPA: alpha/beta hydrolase-fold protein, partial [Chitinophagaceae bacterium]|nr:alpha/beta hydrolase-fold protein [Chitinophagaceae bacterium]